MQQYMSHLSSYVYSGTFQLELECWRKLFPGRDINVVTEAACDFRRLHPFLAHV